jgi:hypothetical protein
MTTADRAIRGKTPYGSTVEVVREGGCGLLHVRKVGDRETPYVCHVLDLTGVTPADVVALDVIKSGAGPLEFPA